MALKLYERYPQLWESPSNDYPQGAFKNLSAQGETDGSYLEKDWLNDYSGFFGALLKNAQITPNGEVDTAQRSQFYDALIKVAKESVDLSAYRKKDDLLFKGSIDLQDTDGTLRGQVAATDQGLQLTQYPKDGGSQTFTFPYNGSGGVLATKDSRTFEEMQRNYVGELFQVAGEVNEGRQHANIYVNGTLKSLGYDYVPILSESMFLNQARFNCYGGQLRDLKNALSNPLHQELSISFIGDSNTWGRGTGQDATFNPRGGRLSDARDHFASNSFVNIFKRYIGMRYFNDTTPQLSNYPTSPSGESICVYSKPLTLFPENGILFKYSKINNIVPTTREREGTLCGYQLTLEYDGTWDQQQHISFNFTGSSFRVYYTSFHTTGDLVISVGDTEQIIDLDRSENVGLQSFVDVSFDYIHDTEIVISTTNNQGEENRRTTRIEGIVINKTITIENNGIIGQNASSYFKHNMEGSPKNMGDFCFIQFGGNDRTTNLSLGARSISTYIESLVQIIEYLSSRGVSPIVMGTSDGMPSTGQAFTRQESATASAYVADILKVDFIDNYSVLLGTGYSDYTSDGTHLTIYGNAVVARNIITSLESSC